MFGPVFETESKRAFGPPQGLDKLRDVTRALSEFPVLAIGGITLENIAACFEAGAGGVAAIRLFDDAEKIKTTSERTVGAALRGRPCVDSSDPGDYTQGRPRRAAPTVRSEIVKANDETGGAYRLRGLILPGGRGSLPISKRSRRSVVSRRRR